jgi:hypothetical protein
MEPRFVEAWARHAIQTKDIEAVKAIVQPQIKSQLGNIRPVLAAQVLNLAGLSEEAGALAEKALNDLSENPHRSAVEMEQAGELFNELGRWNEFEKVLEGRYPNSFFEEMRSRFGIRERRKRMKGVVLD